MSRHPELKWAQRQDKVFITILLPDAKNAKVDVNPDGGFTFSASAGADNYLYELKLDLFDKVDVKESKINIGARSIFCILEKAEKVWWKKLIRGDDKTPHYIKVDWDKWVDEDEDIGEDLDMGGMDFSKFGDMGGMDEFDDSGEDDEELSKPGEQGGTDEGNKPEKEATKEKVEAATEK